MIFKRQHIVHTAIGITSFLLFVTPAVAHVIVTPKLVGIAQIQVFDMSVPTEKDTPTIGIKLLIPAWIHGEVIPNIKPGWTITEQKTGDVVTEIDWTGGSIPPGQRDEFFFQAQVPAQEVTLKWKATQLYQDGSTVEWTHDPTSNPEDDNAPPPYSTTKVINDLTNSKKTTNTHSSNVPLIFSIVALALSALSFGFHVRKK